MIYAIFICTIFALSTAWIIYQLIHIKHMALVVNKNKILAFDEIMIRSHALLLLVLIVLWWLIYNITNVVSVQQASAMNLSISLALLVVLTPLFVYIIKHLKESTFKVGLKQESDIFIRINWTLNILTAIIYASMINHVIQILLFV